MFIFLPIGHDQPIRRMPVLTVSVMVICLLIQIWRSVAAPSQAEILGAQNSVRMLERRVLDRYLVADPDAAVDPDARPNEAAKASSDSQILADFRAGKLAPRTDTLFVALKDADERSIDLPKHEPAYLLGYKPSDGISFRMFTCAFVHSGWLHLAGNLLFLWLCGCNLEDRWGPAIFGALYGFGAIAASAGYALMHRDSQVMCVGASGAIAAAMGAFLVCFWGARLKIVFVAAWRIMRPQIYYWPAYVAGPLWFGSEVLDSMFEAQGVGGGVAHSAHVGGFAFGLAFASVMRLSGTDAKLYQVARKESEWSEDPDFVRGLDLSDQRPEEAVQLLRGVVARNPGHREARIELLRAAIAAKDTSAAASVASGAIAQLGELFAWPELVAYYRAMMENVPAAALTDRALAFVVRAALKTGDTTLALETTKRLLTAHPESPLLAGALWDVATIQQREGLSIVDPTALERFVPTGV